MIRWLHISDLHLNSKGASTAMLRDELPHFLRKKGLLCDYVFCTGDIRTANEKPNDYTDDMAAFIKDICKAVGTSTERLFVVPGNHDIDRDNAKRLEAIKRVKYQPEWLGNYDSKTGLIAENDMADIMEGQADFIKFLGKIYNDDRLKYYGSKTAPHFNIETEDFNILHVDSTVIYAKNQEKSDLIVGTEALYGVVKKLNPDKPTILLTHYPFTALTQDEKNVLSTMLQKHEIRLWLAGHEHDHILQAMHYLDSLQSGELRLENGAKASVLIGEYDSRTGRCCITAYAWYDEGWAQYPLVDLDNKSHPERYECFLRPLNDCVKSFEYRLAQEANKDYYNRLPEKVEKALLPSILAEDEITTLEALMSETWQSDTPHIILLADGGMGKTTMLLDYCRNIDQPTLYVPAERLAALNISFEQYCISQIFEGDSELFNNSLSKKLSTPTLTLFIDGLNEINAESERRFIMEIQRLNLLKGLRILVSSRSNFTLRYSMPGYKAVGLCPLDDEQIKSYFSPNEWANVLNSGDLHRLLQNPMMVTMYKEICSVIDEYRNVEFLDWILPVKNATDLFHDYYVAQLALMMKRGYVDGKQMLFAWTCIHDLLPAIADAFEASHNIHYEKSQFRNLLSGLLTTIHIDADKLLPIQEYYRETSLPKLDYLDVFDLLSNSLRLLYEDKSTVGFPHQMYRDYLAAQWIIKQTGIPDKTYNLWNQRTISLPVVAHIRQGSGRYWEEGLANAVHQAGKERTGGNASLLVENLFECFPYAKTSGIPDYSGLDLKGHLLPDSPVPSSRISLKDTEIDEQTLGLTFEDTIRFTDLCLSEDKAFLAAIDSDKCSIYIYDLRSGKLCLTHDLGKHISKMEFYGSNLFVVAGGLNIYAQNSDWMFIGVIEEKEGWITYKLKSIIEKDGELYLYYNNRMVKYRLADCRKVESINGKLWKEPVDGFNLSSLMTPFPWKSTFRHKGVLAKVGDSAFQVLSYNDGRLIVMSGNETIAVLAKGIAQLLDATISGDGSKAATLSFNVFGDTRKVQLWDLNAQKKTADIYCPETVSVIHLSETGEWLLGEYGSHTWVCNCNNGKAKWYDEVFVSNQMNQLLSIGNKVLRKKEQYLYQFDLFTEEEKEIESPIANPALVCFLNDGSLAAVDKKRKKVFLHSIRGGDVLTLYPDGSEILSIQSLKNQPFIAVICKDGIISLYHMGTGQRVRKLQTESNAKIVLVHPDLSLIADTDGSHSLETHNYYEWIGKGGRKMGRWYNNSYNPKASEPEIGGDILDIAFNPHSNQLVAILANGRIMFFNDKYCKYHDSFSIITAFDVDAYDFRDCICDDALKGQLTRNGALI